MVSHLSSRERTETVAPKPKSATAVLVLNDGTVFWGQGFGHKGKAVGEVCFNTSMTGYEEILTDPSYAGQIINFTFPHIGNIGANREDREALKPRARGLIVRTEPTLPSNWRAEEGLNSWLEQNQLVGLYGLDTRALTIRIRDLGAPNGVLVFDPATSFDLDALRAEAKAWPGLEGMDLAKDVTCEERYEWHEPRWQSKPSYPEFHVVAIDYGAKQNILRCLISAGCRVTVLPASATFSDITACQPDGIFLSNGPGDPAATGLYAVPVIRSILEARIPLFGICLGHQLLGLALGGRTAKMSRGHRGANHPVKDLATGKVEITSQNHGFMVLPDTLPPTVEVTHISLFDGTNEGLRLKDRPAFSVQYHPEASPGPHDSHYLFTRFIQMIRDHKGIKQVA